MWVRSLGEWFARVAANVAPREPRSLRWADQGVDGHHGNGHSVYLPDRAGPCALSAWGLDVLRAGEDCRTTTVQGRDTAHGSTRQHHLRFGHLGL
jgi:hypothetical protein